MKNNKATGTWKTIWNDSFGKLKKHQSIQVLNNLLTFGPINERTEQVSMEVQTWSGLDFANRLRVESTFLEDMPAIWMFSLALHNNEGNNKIYITGGRLAEGWRSRFESYQGTETLSSCYAYDLKNQTVTQVKSMEEGHKLHSSCIMNNRLYVIGGQRGSDQDGNTFEMLDLKELSHDGCEWRKYEIPISPYTVFYRTFFSPIDDRDLLFFAQDEDEENYAYALDTYTFTSRKLCRIDDQSLDLYRIMDGQSAVVH